MQWSLPYERFSDSASAFLPLSFAGRWLCFFGLIFAGVRNGEAQVTMTELPDRVRVEIAGQLFTEYRFRDSPHVYFYPILGPGNLKMTRSWPLEEAPGEEHDHPHHRSLWFAHGKINGVDFWTEPASHPGKAPPLGKIVHEKFLEIRSGEKEGVIRDQLDWIGPDGDQPLRSVQTLRVLMRPENERVFDFEMALTAGAKEVVFGDTKEGTFGMRIAETMRLTRPDKKPGEGHILNSEGDIDAAAWGKHARWVDMSGPIDGQEMGIAIFDHPQNPRFPTRWHARDYGLFAANPFCENEMDPSQPKGSGDLRLPAGKTITFRYRIYLHRGNAAAGKVGEHYLDFTQP